MMLFQANCLDVFKNFDDKSFDALITDPPYGCGKADWDDEFPKAWYGEARRVANMVVIITGGAGLKDSIDLVGGDFIDVVAARNMNALTRSPIGFSNWLAAVVAVGKPPRAIPNAFDFSVRGAMPDHPSPKPIEYMVKLLMGLTSQDQKVLDPFMGSGTTGVACIRTGRRFTGIEVNPDYFELASRRIGAESSQLKLNFDKEEEKVDQTALW